MPSPPRAPGPAPSSSPRRARIDALAQTYARRYPAAVKCLLTDREQLTSYLRFLLEHHKRIRHSNFIERTFGETRRRVKVTGRLPGETSCLNLVWAVLDRASRGWRGVNTTSTGLRHLHDLRRQLLDPPTPLRRTSAAARSTSFTPLLGRHPGERPRYDVGSICR
jgi:putative transposase